ncbi:MAG: hypothetical protein H6754_01780 [Candidatus Omnitrophica bacterium]|nr:hypothetical protein [Candidatus Omnitrophota bacterium]
MSTEIKNVTLIYGAFKEDFFTALKKCQVKDIVVLEGRPTLESSRHAVLNLKKIGIIPTIIADNMAGYLFSKGLVKETWLASQAEDKAGAMCEIGALILAVLAKNHQIPVFTYAAEKKRKPLGKPADLQKFNGQSVVTGKIKAFVPLIEWVPAKYLRSLRKNAGRKAISPRLLRRPNELLAIGGANE